MQVDGRGRTRRSPCASTPTRPIFPKAHIQALSNLVAGEVSGKGLHPEQAALGVDHRRHMDICVRIDAARQGALSHLP